MGEPKMDPDHRERDRTCMCATCRTLGGKVVLTPAWRAFHHTHLTTPDFAREAFPHPSGTWYFLVCACGAKHLTSD